jgi:hypothetical protein
MSVDQIAFAGHSEIAGMVPEKQGLYVVKAALGGIGILDTAQAQTAGEFFELSVGEHLAQKALATIGMRSAFLVKCNDAGPFLTAVLEVVQSVIDEGGGVPDAIYCKYAHYCNWLSLSSTIL